MHILHSIILGKGTPFIILHGFLGMADNWKTLGTRYAENGFQVHLVDQRNHGKSFHSDYFDFDILADDIKNYLQYHGLSSAVVMGHSMGGKVAMQLAVDFPERVDKLIVADIAPRYYPPHHQHIIDALNKLDFDTITSRKQADEALAQYFPETGIRQFLLKNLYWVTKERLDLRFNLKVLQNKMEEIIEAIPPHSTYSKPTLFIIGDRSEYVQPSDHGTIKTHFPEAIIETVENAGHWLHAENPKEFFRKSMAFLQR